MKSRESLGTALHSNRVALIYNKVGKVGWWESGELVPVSHRISTQKQPQLLYAFQ
jgi:hypothetical protein